ncbi:protein kinase [Candidatus Uabimicrobium sp. HlEnr_7]|uniref:protein kinase domain-containing protein n=1 Tax=Candidatus Uabimicrobium helgolandensis TaxID=3095367 RepID=UPI003556151A
MKEKDVILKKIETIWKATLCGDELPSSTIKCDYIELRETTPEIFSGEQQNTLLEERQTLIEESQTLIEESDGTSQKHSGSLNDFEDFEVVGELGRGGMGIVYLARQKSLNREIALKVISPKQNHNEMQKRFISEAIVTADLDHPNIIPIHALSKGATGQVSIAMKKVNGISWGQLLHPETPGEIERSEKMELFDHLDILCRICDAVAYAHSHKIIHRDLKPENIMIGDFGEVLVMDWGIALDISEKKTSKTLHRSEIQGPEGTPLYMAPEMALNHIDDIGVATDVYLCGAMLYEVLYGVPPHHGKTVMEILCHAAEGGIPKTASSYFDLDKIVCKTLAHDPKERFSSVLDLKEEIQQFVRHYDAMSIVDNAVDQLNELEHKDTVTNQDVYITGDEIYNCFLQALKIQKNNKIATDGIVRITRLQAKWAQRHEDLNMIELYIGRLNQLENKPEDELQKMENRLHTLRGFRKNIMYTLVAIFIFWGIVSFVKESIAEENRISDLLLKYQDKSRELLKRFHFAQQKNDVQSVVKVAKDMKKIHVEMKHLAAQTEKIKEIGGISLATLRYNITYLYFQMGNYQDAVTLLKEELDEVKSNEKFTILNFLQQNNIVLPNNTIPLLENRKLDVLFRNICYLADSAVCSVEVLDKIWRHCCEVSEQQISKRLEDACSAAFLCLSANSNRFDNKKELKKAQQLALQIDLPVDLWHLLSFTDNGDSLAVEAQQSPLKLEKKQGRIWGTNLLKNKVWFFPPQNLDISICNFLFFPRKKQVCVGSDFSLFVLNSDNGNILHRYRLPHRVRYLSYIDKSSFALEMSSSSMAEEGYRAIFDVDDQKFVTPLGICDETLMLVTSRSREANQLLANRGFTIFATDMFENKWPETRENIVALERYVDELLEFDKENIWYSLAKAIALKNKQQNDKALKLVEKITSQQDVHFNEYLLLGLFCNFYNLTEFESIFYEKATSIQVKSLHNPNLDVFFISSVNWFFKKLGDHYFKTGQYEKAFSLLEVSRDFFGFSEGDYYLYLFLAKWAKNNNFPQKAEKFTKLYRESRFAGGGLMGTSIDLQFADFLIFFNSFFSFLLLGWIFYMWYRARVSRISDLESIGYHNIFLRNMAFLANPFTRARYTFITYLNRSERLCLCFFILLYFIGAIFLSAIVANTGKTASLPNSLGNGYMGGKGSYSYLQKLEGKMNETTWTLLMAEAEYQRGNTKKAVARWQKTTHPIANNNLGVFYSESDPEKARLYFEKNQGTLYENLTKVNLAILNKKAVSSELMNSLPNIYQKHLRIFSRRCLIAFCTNSMFTSITVEEGNFIFRALKLIFVAGNGVAEIGEDVSFLVPMTVGYSFIGSLSRLEWGSVVILVFTLIGLFSNEREIHKQSESFLFVDKMLLYFGHLTPGWVWTVKREGLYSFLGFLLSIICFCSFALVYFNGGILSSIAFPTLPFIDSLDYFQPWYLSLYYKVSVVVLVLLMWFSIKSALQEKEESFEYVIVNE